MKLTMILNSEPLGAPFAPKRKCYWWIPLVQYGLQAGASVASTAMTNSSNEEMNEENIAMQRETNALNAELQREANAQNYKIFQEQNAFNVDMWNKQNAYNDPKEQVRRLIAAGINPSTGLGQASQAGSLTSANAPNMVAPQMQAPKNTFAMQYPDFNGLGNAGAEAVNAWNASRLADADIKHKNALSGNIVADTLLKQRTLDDTVKLLSNQAQREGVLGDMARQQLSFIKATQDYDIAMRQGDMRMQEKSYELLQQQIDSQKIHNDISKVTLAYADSLNKAQIAQIWSAVNQAQAQIGLINANTMMTQEQRLTEAKRRVGIIMDNKLKGVDYKVQKAVSDYMISSAESEAEINRWRAIDALNNSGDYGKMNNNRDVSDLLRYANPQNFFGASAVRQQMFRRGLPSVPSPRGYLPK